LRPPSISTKPAKLPLVAEDADDAVDEPLHGTAEKRVAQLRNRSATRLRRSCRMGRDRLELLIPGR